MVGRLVAVVNCQIARAFREHPEDFGHDHAAVRDALPAIQDIGGFGPLTPDGEANAGEGSFELSRRQGEARAVGET